jgi:threonine dehydrogenase-like Zn-dependent dehydrogenase
VGLLPKKMSRPIMMHASTDRLAALDLAFQGVRRGGTVAISGVYAGAQDPISMQLIFDKQLTLRMGQANVKRWVDDILPLAYDDADPLGLESFATHHLTLDEAPQAYEMFQKKQDGAIKVLFKP